MIHNFLTLKTTCFPDDVSQGSPVLPLNLVSPTWVVYDPGEPPYICTACFPDDVSQGSQGCAST